MPTEVSLLTEPFVTIKQAASKIGVHYWLLLKVVNSGAVPIYTLGNARKRVRISEVVAYVEATKKGGSR